MAAVTCPSADDLRRCVIGLADESEAERILGHVETCPTCQAVADALTRAGDSLLGVPARMAARGSETLQAAPEAAGAPRVAPAETELPDVPGYEVLAEVGRGGMGVVYKARHRALNRLVALKMILAAELASAEQLLRFRLEAEMAARVQHANILQVYEVGAWHGRPFLELEWVDGGSLAEWLAGKPQPPREAARVVEVLARAAHAAHCQGVIHRDLKPANVLMAFSRETVASASGEALATVSRLNEFTPKITDFGLAKSTRGDSGVTQSGAIVGTPEYMAPEQAAGHKQVGLGADVYALGVILYEALTGRPPFKGTGTLQTLQQVATQEPASPRSLRPEVPRDLETVCLKALRKDPQRRYASASELADDLRRFQAGEPVRARRIGTVERVLKWAKRRPAAAALVVAVHLLGAGLLGAGVWFADQLRHERNAANEARQTADELAQSEHAAHDEAETSRRLAERAVIDMQTASGLTADEQRRPALAALWFASAAARSANEPERERANRVRFRVWEQQCARPVRAFDCEGQLLRTLTFDPSERYLLTRSESGRLTVWDVETEQPVSLDGVPAQVTAAAWSPDGHTLAAGTPEGTIALLPFPGGERLPDLRLDGPVTAVAYSRDGRYLAAGGNEVRVWDCRERRFVSPPLPHPRPVVHLVFGGQGRLLASSCQDNQVRVFDVPGDSKAAPRLAVPHQYIFAGPIELYPAPVFLADDRLLVTAPTSFRLAAHDPTTGVARRGVTLPGHGNASLCASRDGKVLAVGGFHWAQLFRAFPDDWAPLRPGPVTPTRHTVGSLAFGGQSLIAGVFDTTARLWSLSEPDPSAPELAHQDDVHLVAAAPGRGLFATAQLDGLVRLWRQPGEPFPRWQARPLSHPGPFGSRPVPLSRDGTLVLVPVAGGGQVHHFPGGEPAGPPLSWPGPLQHAAFSPEGRGLLTAHDPGEARFWDWQSGRPCPNPVPTGGPVVALAWSPDGRRAATLTRTGEVLLIDGSTGAVINSGRHPETSWNGYTAPVVAWSPDGQLFATAGMKKSMTVWDGTTGQSRYALPCGLAFAEFSPDGRLLLTTTWDRQARLWNAATGEPQGEPMTHPGIIHRGHFSPDGRTFLTACADGQVRQWDPARHEAVGSVMPHKDEVYDALFTPDGRWIVSLCRDRTAYLWDPVTGKSVGSVFLGKYWPDLTTSVLRLTPDGRFLFINDMSAFDLSALSDPDPHRLSRPALLDLGEVVAGHVVVEGTVRKLSSPEWLQRWRRFRGEHPNVHILPGPGEGPSAGPPPEPVEPRVVVTPGKPTRPASAEQVRAWVADLGGPRAAEAARRLEEVGPPALAALAEAARTAPPALRKTLDKLQGLIEMNRALAPARVTLDLKDVPPADAIAALSRQARIPLVYSPGAGGSPAPGLVTLKLDDVPVWDALARLGEIARLGLAPSFDGTLHLTPSPAMRPLAVASSGPFRLEITGVTRTSTLAGREGVERQESLTLNGTMIRLPQALPLRTGPPRVAGADQEGGASLLPPAAPQGPTVYDPSTPALAPRWFQVVLLSPARPAGALKRLRLDLPVELIATRRLLEIPDLDNNRDKPFRAAGGLTVTVQRIQRQGPFHTIDVAWEDGDESLLDRAKAQVRAEDASGHSLAPFQGFPAPNEGRLPVDRAVLLSLGVAPGAGFPATLPWGGLARAGHPSGVQRRLFFRADADTGPAAKLVIEEVVRRTRVEVPFEFENVPLP